MRSLIFAALLLAGAPLARAVTVQRLSPAGGLGSVSIKHLKANAAGDFVAVTNTRVYIGNAAQGPVELLATAPDLASFALDDSTTLTGTGTTTQNITVDAELYDTRLDLNANGDFVVLTNSLIFVGNVRNKTFQQVGDSGRGTEFQEVRLNDAGQYVAVSDNRIFGGTVKAAAATLLVDDAIGTFLELDLFGAGTSAEVTAGDHRLALNAKGQFVAITHSAVYAGDLGSMTASKAYEEDRIGFLHVTLSEAGTFVIAADQDVFSGAF